MITIPVLAVIIQSAVLILLLLGIYVKLISRILTLEKENEAARKEFANHVQYVKDEFKEKRETDNKVIVKLESIETHANGIKIDITDIKAQLKYSKN